MITVTPHIPCEQPDPIEVNMKQMENIRKALGTGKASNAASSIGELLRHRGMSHDFGSERHRPRGALPGSFGKSGNPTLQVLLDSLRAVGLTLVVAEAKEN